MEKKTNFLLDLTKVDLGKIINLALEPCENYTGQYICSDDPSRSPDAIYGSEQYCPPCRIRDAFNYPSVINKQT